MTVTARGQPLVFDRIAKRFGAFQALAETSLQVGGGEFVTLLGPSGSGKTTLLNIAAGYLPADQGRVLLGDRDVTDLPPRRRNIGMVFQSYALFPHLDVFDNVAYGLKVRGRPANEIKQRVDAALAMVRLDGFGSRAVHALSGGQQQRVALARAMVIEPDLLLMDEPLGALDRQLRKHVQVEIRRLHLAQPRTTVYVTHDQEEALVMSDRIAVMSHGRIEQIGTPTELYRAPINAFVATFLGESNLLPVTIVDRARGEVTFRIDGAEAHWRIPLHAGIPAGDRAVLLVRPEDLVPASPTEPALEGVVTESVYLGEITALRIAIAHGIDLAVRQMRPPASGIGSSIRIRLDPSSVRLLEAPPSDDKQAKDHQAKVHQGGAKS